MKVQKIDIWMGEIRDETGGLASAIAPLVAAGVDFSFVIGTRRAEKPGAGTVYFGGLRGAKQSKAADSRRLCQIAGRAWSARRGTGSAAARAPVDERAGRRRHQSPQRFGFGDQVALCDDLCFRRGSRSRQGG